MVQSKPLAPATRDDDRAAAPSARTDSIVLRAVVAGSWLAWAIPWPVWHVASAMAGVLCMLTGRRRVVLANVRHARAGSPPPAIVAWYIGAQQIATHCKTVVGTLRAGIRQPDHTDRLTMRGLPNLVPYLNERGIIVVAPHAGPYPTLGLMASRWLREHGFVGELAVVARLFRPFRSGSLMTWFIGCFTKAGATIIPVDQSPLRMASRLRSVLDAKGIVVLFVDEPTPTPSVAVPFFDGAIKLPVGPVRLAQATGSVILPCIVTFGKGPQLTGTFSEPIEPTGSTTATLTRVAKALETMIGEHLDQWAMLTPIWEPAPLGPPAGHGHADLHLHTVGSDGLCQVDEWVEAAGSAAVNVIAVTDHDHLATVRNWQATNGYARTVLPGVEVTARGRIVHVGVLFPDELPASLPRPGTPLPDVVRWARGVRGSIVVLVHPLPLLWRRQLRRLAEAGLLPDAIETRFPLVGWRTPALERAAAAYGLATLGGSDAHLAPSQLGRHVTEFPGETVDDLVAAIRAGTTRAVTRPAGARPPLAVFGLQVVYSWLLPFQRVPLVGRARARLLRRARARVLPPTPTPSPSPSRQKRAA